MGIKTVTKTVTEYKASVEMSESQPFPLTKFMESQLASLQERTFPQERLAMMFGKSLVVPLTYQGYKVNDWKAVPVTVQYRYVPATHRFWTALKAQFQKGTSNRVGLTVLSLGIVLSAVAFVVAANTGVVLGDGNTPFWVTIPVAMFILGVLGVLGSASHQMEPVWVEKLEQVTG